MLCVILTLLPALAVGEDWFTDEAVAAGLDFVHINGMSGERYYPEVVGPGAALFDYDNDGDLDIYLVQGRMLGVGKTTAEAIIPPRPGSEPLRDRLYRNDLLIHPDGRRELHFTDVTHASGIRGEDYGIGVAAGDLDNDGWVDLYVTNYGNNRLWHNNGDGTFSLITETAGANDPRLSVSAAFLDMDRDGWLDLYVVNHVSFDIRAHKPCQARLGGAEYCATDVYPPVSDSLFHNLGKGTFENVSRKAGIDKVYAAGLGVVTADFNGDGWMDIYVANDGDPNQLWINLRDGRFRDEALLAGAAVNMNGAAEAGMGVDAGDFDGDGDEDLFMTHDIKETNTIYVNDGQGWFEDRSVTTGLGLPSQRYTGFGTAWLDYDNDSWLDLLVVNGAVRSSDAAPADDPYPLGQTNQLFSNLGNGRFKEVTGQAGAVFALSEVSRGAAFGDVDNDGDQDILVANNSGPVRLLLNHLGNRRPWLGLRLLDKSGRDALGARVQLRTARGRSLWRRVRTDASYASANDPRLLFGLDNDAKLAGVRVYWPSGRVEDWYSLPVRRYTRLKEGEGAATPYTFGRLGSGKGSRDTP